MSDYMAAEITLGGPLPRRLVRQVCATIAKDGVSLEWGEASFLPKSAAHLLAARREDQHGVAVLKLYADEKPYGEFELLEEFLQRHKLTYRRVSDGKYEFDPELVENRPALGLVRYLASHSGAPLVSLAKFRGATRAMENALALLDKRQPATARRELDSSLSALHCDMPREIPALTPFEIGKGGRRAQRA